MGVLVNPNLRSKAIIMKSDGVIAKDMKFLLYKVVIVAYVDGGKDTRKPFVISVTAGIYCTSIFTV